MEMYEYRHGINIQIDSDTITPIETLQLILSYIFLEPKNITGLQNAFS